MRCGKPTHMTLASLLNHLPIGKADECLDWDSVPVAWAMPKKRGYCLHGQGEQTTPHQHHLLHPSITSWREWSVGSFCQPTNI